MCDACAAVALPSPLHIAKAPYVRKHKKAAFERWSFERWVTGVILHCLCPQSVLERRYPVGWVEIARGLSGLLVYVRRRDY